MYIKDWITVVQSRWRRRAAVKMVLNSFVYFFEGGDSVLTEKLPPPPPKNSAPWNCFQIGPTLRIKALGIMRLMPRLE
jgi:hypothetical protein